MIDLNEFAQGAMQTAKKREAKGQLKSDTMSILKHCAGEVVEAMEAFDEYRFLGDDMSYIELNKSQFADELADIITCALIAAANEDINIEAALLRVQKKNARRAE